MAQTVNVNIKMDADVKKSMERACEAMGLSADPFYESPNVRYLKSVMDDVEQGKAHFAEHALIED